MPCGWGDGWGNECKHVTYRHISSTYWDTSHPCPCLLAWPGLVSSGLLIYLIIFYFLKTPQNWGRLRPLLLCGERWKGWIATKIQKNPLNIQAGNILTKAHLLHPDTLLKINISVHSELSWPCNPGCNWLMMTGAARRRRLFIILLGYSYVVLHARLRSVVVPGEPGLWPTQSGSCCGVDEEEEKEEEEAISRSNQWMISKQQTMDGKEEDLS